MIGIYCIIPLLCLTCLGGCLDKESALPEAIGAIVRYNADPITVTGTASIIRTGTPISDPNGRITLEPVNPRDRAIELPGIFRHYSAKDRLMAKRVATADAYKKLALAIYDLKVSEAQTVRDVVGMQQQSRIDTVLRNQNVSAARYLDDGTVEVDVSLELADAIELLKENGTTTHVD